MVVSAESIQTDDRGRPIAADGYPISGLATVDEAAAAMALSRSQIYAMIQRGELQAKRFGRACRVPWSAVRELISTD
jgi:excisionase family DNA binding protein